MPNDLIRNQFLETSSLFVYCECISREDLCSWPAGVPPPPFRRQTIEAENKEVRTILLYLCFDDFMHLDERETRQNDCLMKKPETFRKRWESLIEVLINNETRVFALRLNSLFENCLKSKSTNVSFTSNSRKLPRNGTAAECLFLILRTSE